jgi:hypothetical protein
LGVRLRSLFLFLPDHGMSLGCQASTIVNKALTGLTSPGTHIAARPYQGTRHKAQGTSKLHHHIHHHINYIQRHTCECNAIRPPTIVPFAVPAPSYLTLPGTDVQFSYCSLCCSGLRQGSLRPVLQERIRGLLDVAAQLNRQDRGYNLGLAAPRPGTLPRQSQS